MVREHFALLAAVVRDHDGAVVKTIGDAVMASFGDPAQAVTCRARHAGSDRFVGAYGRRSCPEGRRSCRAQRGRDA